MTLYRKRVLVIEAMQYQGTNGDEIEKWSIGEVIIRNDLCSLRTRASHSPIEVGDWIIKGNADEFYPCDSDFFDRTYEAIES